MPPLLGAHMSIAGGFHKAVKRAADVGCDCVQIFLTPPRKWPRNQSVTENNSQEVGRGLEVDAIRRFQAALAEHTIQAPIAHAAYLINLASPDPDLWKRSIDAFIVELQSAEQLGIRYVVLHPGSYTTSSESVGLCRVAAALDEIFAQVRSLSVAALLETTAGQGTNLGYSFEHLAEMLSRARDPDRLGVCLDTCHVFAAGYPLAGKKEYLATIRRFNQTVGLPKLKAIHVNDSQRPFGSRVDRHAHIGQGHMGLEPFRLLLRDRRLQRIPMYLETPKGMKGKTSWDVVNLKTLRRLAGNARDASS